MEESNNLNGVISLEMKFEIKPVKFKNYRTKRFIEDFLVVMGVYDIGLIHERYLNAEHKFSKLLANKRDAILRDKNAMKITENFFMSILKMTKIVDGKIIFETKSVGAILGKQKQILRWFVKKDLMSEEERRDYELTKEDFPPIWF
jgi:hypothetical protein